MQALGQDAEAAVEQGGGDQGVKPTGRRQQDIRRNPDADQTRGAQEKTDPADTSRGVQKKIGQGGHSESRGIQRLLRLRISWPSQETGARKRRAVRSCTIRDRGGDGAVKESTTRPNRTLADREKPLCNACFPLRRPYWP